MITLALTKCKNRRLWIHTFKVSGWYQCNGTIVLMM